VVYDCGTPEACVPISETVRYSTSSLPLLHIDLLSPDCILLSHRRLKVALVADIAVKWLTLQNFPVRSKILLHSWAVKLFHERTILLILKILSGVKSVWTWLGITHQACSV
jgi:hypothetical protein